MSKKIDKPGIELFLLSKKIVQADLMVVELEKLAEVVPMKYIGVDFWNSEGFFQHWALGLEDLKGHANDCISGFAFNNHYDVSWRIIGASYQFALAVEPSTSSKTEASLSQKLIQLSEKDGWELDDHEPSRIKRYEDITILLWGTKCIAEDPDDGLPTSKWVELRIPRILSYPIVPGGTKPGGTGDYDSVFMKVRAYYDHLARPVFYRRHKLQAYVKRGVDTQAGNEIAGYLSLVDESTSSS